MNNNASAKIVIADLDALEEAGRIVASGGVVVFPTDTVYGLACDLFNAEAVHRIYEIKGRPANMPLIAMMADTEQWADVAADLPSSARILMERWWPGPITLVVPAREDIPTEVLGGGKTIGMRIPDLEVARDFLRRSHRPLATTSANRSGQPSAITAQQAADEVGDMVDLILDAGPSPQGLASTVVDCTVMPPRVLREGPITAAMLGLVG